MNDLFAVILVYATSHALKAEKLLLESGVQSKLIPVPRHLSSDCGVCLRIHQTDMEVARSVLEMARMDFEGIYTI